MIVAGVMSGTSADGVNVALARILGAGASLRWQLLGHAAFPYPAAVRSFVLKQMNAGSSRVADLARLNFLLGEIYADAVQQTLRDFKVSNLELIGCHGQTLYHQGEPAAFLGRKLSVTWQTGEGAVLAARTAVPVVSDFRPADMAAGGKGAPLVPMLDFLVYGHRRRGRILQNIGGIGNLTAIPAGAKSDQVIAFDTGPGNMVIDACMERLYGRRFDKDGRVAASGTALQHVLAEVLRQPYFRKRPPKTAGREEFGREFVSRFLKLCRRARPQDVIATATEITAASIARAIGDFVLTGSSGQYSDFVCAGGGTRNKTLVAALQKRLSALNLKWHTSDEFGVPAEAKEALAFALLAYLTWNRKPGNIPSATGAQRPAILGKVSYV
jgi:anhydro-N-acetylmuramic acid kinase